MLFKKSFFACVFLPLITVCSDNDFRLEGKNDNRKIWDTFHIANQKAFTEKNLGPLTRVIKQNQTLVNQYSPDQAMRLLILAIKKDNSILAKAMIKSGKIAPDAQDKNGLIPLGWAIQKGSKSLVTLLLKNGVNPNSRDKQRNHPLKIAMLKREKRLIRALLRSGSHEPNIFEQPDFQEGFVKIKTHMNSIITKDPVASLIWENSPIPSASPVKSNEFGWSPLRAALSVHNNEFVHATIVNLAEQINKETNSSKKKKLLTPIIAIMRHPDFQNQEQLVSALLIDQKTGAFFENTANQIQRKLDCLSKKTR